MKRINYKYTRDLFTNKSIYFNKPTIKFKTSSPKMCMHCFKTPN